MLVPNQKVEVKWNPANKKWYEEKGYVFTKFGESFMCKIIDLRKFCKIEINAICDYCNSEYSKMYFTYNNGREILEKDCCENCKGKKRSEISRLKNCKKYFDIIRKICKENNYILLSSEKDFIGLHDTIIKYICPIHGEITQWMNNMVEGHLCRFCGRKVCKDNFSLSQDEVKNRIESKNRKWLNYGEYISMFEKNLIIECLCGQSFVTSLGDFRKTDGFCKSCIGKNRGDMQRNLPDDVENHINNINGNILLNKTEYIKNSFRNLKILCGECKEHIFETSLTSYDRGQIRCKFCSQKFSIPERIVKDFLDKYNIEYIKEYSFKDCKDKNVLPFDFYLPTYNLIIETDGQHHFYSVWGENHLEKTQKHDKIKNAYCNEHNINLVRIPYWDFSKIESILIEKLNLPQIVEIKLPNNKIFKYKTHKSK